jgi:oxalate decarboxylase/phosphoglucose isomerase-like protein (cupin superfamily)
MENFCKIGKIEKKDGYDVCRDVKRKNGLRYDLTLIYPQKQTAGHYHFGDEPELYEVISGEAQFLTQNKNSDETYLINAKEKDKIVFPPGFSVRIINNTDENLIVADWINDEVKNDYNAFQNVPEPVKLAPKPLPKELEDLNFLSEPEKYKDILTIKKLYEKI